MSSKRFIVHRLQSLNCLQLEKWEKKWIRNIKNNFQYYISFDKLFSRVLNTEPFQSTAKSKLLEISFCYFHNSGLCSNYFVSQTFSKRVTYAIFCLAWRIVRLSVRRLQLLNNKGDKYADRHINNRISSRCVATHALFSKQKLYWLFHDNGFSYQFCSNNLSHPNYLKCLRK